MSDEYKLKTAEFLNEYVKIKQEAKPGNKKLAAEWLQKAYNTEREKYVIALGHSRDNFSQDIPIDEIEHSELEMILDDYEYLNELMFAGSNILTTCYELYHNPDLFNVYEGVILGETVYYVELKSAEVSSINFEEMFS